LVLSALLGAVFSVVAGAGCISHHDQAQSQTYVDLAKDLLGKGQDVSAETEVKKAIGFDPENAEAYYVYGIIYIVRAAHFENLVERENCLSGSDADALRGEADEAMHQADTQLAKASRLADDYGEVWMSRGVVAIHFGEFDKAVEYCTKALANSGRLASAPLARANLGWALHQRKDSVKATTELLQAVQESPTLCLGRYRLAQVYYDRGEFDEAAAQLELFGPKAPAAAQGQAAPVRCDPPVVEALLLGGEVAEKTQGPGAGGPWFLRCIDAAPKSCVAKQCSKALTQASTAVPAMTAGHP
jgi:tetratricopeptide (TPR) repeat protein